MVSLEVGKYNFVGLIFLFLFLGVDLIDGDSKL